MRDPIKVAKRPQFLGLASRQVFLMAKPILNLTVHIRDVGRTVAISFMKALCDEIGAS
jgi:hypothetical protein